MSFIIIKAPQILFQLCRIDFSRMLRKHQNFMTTVKQQGALLAKGRLLGIQFDTLFTEDLYFKISRHALDMADKMKKCFIQKGYEFYLASPTNQQFVILENNKMEMLQQNVRFSFWEKLDEKHTVVRFAVSWATREENIRILETFL